MMCVPPGILCAPNKMTSSQMGWLELSRRSGSEGDESLNSLPPSLGTLGGGAVQEERSISTRRFSPKQPQGFVGHRKWLLNIAWPEFPKGQLQRVHLPCTWLLPGPVRSAQVKFLPSPAQKCRVGETGNSCFILGSVFTANKCS